MDVVPREANTSSYLDEGDLALTLETTDALDRNPEKFGDFGYGKQRR